MVSVERGFALLVVLWVVAIISAISLSLVASTRVEARIAADEWSRLESERRARSGQEVAEFLKTHFIGQPNEDLQNLPVKVVSKGFRYIVAFPEGEVEMLLESDIGKLNPATTDPQFLQNFATLWKGDENAAEELTDSLEDWIDMDSEVRPKGAEAGFYSSFGYAPRNYAFGLGDLPLIRGLNIQDFVPSLEKDVSHPTVRDSLDDFITPIPSGRQINPNFAPLLVLRAVPGITEEEAVRIATERRSGGMFGDVADLQQRTGIRSDSGALPYFRFDQWMAPSILTITHEPSGRGVKTERRVSELMPIFDGTTGSYIAKVRVHRIERNHLPDFAR